MPFLHGYGMTVTTANTWPLSQLGAPSHRMQADLHTGRLASSLTANLEAAASSPTLTTASSPCSDTTMSGQRQINTEIYTANGDFIEHTAEWLQCMIFIDGEEPSGGSRDSLECRQSFLECS
jgi:hypothetical protein